MIRKRLFDLVEPPIAENQKRDIYDVFMFFVIIVSLIPLAFKNHHAIFQIIDLFCTGIFIIDYIFRWITADYRLNKRKMSFILHPITPMAIVDFISILPGLTPLNRSFRLLKFFRLFRTLRIFRVFKAVRYSKNIAIILKVFRKQKDSLLVVCGLAVGYIIVSALVIINVEPDTFNNFFEALYWATVSLTTVGYGDIYAVSTAGKIITMISSVFGIAIVALPASIITAGYMEEIDQSKNNEPPATD